MTELAPRHNNTHFHSCAALMRDHNMILFHVDVLGNCDINVSDRGPVPFIFWLICPFSQVNLTSYLATKRQKPFSPPRNLEQLRILNNWVISWDAIAYRPQSEVAVQEATDVEEREQFFYSNSTEKRNCDFYLVSVVLCKLQNITSWISYYCSYKHTHMLQHFRDFFFVKATGGGKKQQPIIRVIIHTSILWKSRKVRQIILVQFSADWLR